ncbi:MAG TPA: lytic transglycosylase [Ruminiclostridium sp.]|nr:lytic transglycosylase domain-containing protein [Clostridiaceae bacterium]HAA25754.1 lytic transglycosylase [Ruminiclostridium sp.]
MRKKNRNRFRLSCIGGILLLFVIAALFAPILLKKLFPMPYLEIVKKYAADNQLKITLVYSVMKTESGFRTEVVSPKGAVGLMQITEKTGRWIADSLGDEDYDCDDLKKPEVNIKYGCWYLSYLLERFEGNNELALAAYNAGEGTVRRWVADNAIEWRGFEIKSVPYTETEKYLVRVNRIYFVYKTLYPEMDSW